MSRRRGFTLIELLVVVAIITLLVGILLPSIAAGRSHARAAVCQANAYHLHMANQMYAAEWGDLYVAAASDLHEGFGGRHRWHGVRQSDGMHPEAAQNVFDPRRGPLAEFLGDGGIKECPELDVAADAPNAFEAGCGGYGYNSVGVGSRTYELGPTPAAMRTGMPGARIQRAQETVMFTDAAFLQGWQSPYLIEYSFAEPPRFVMADGAGGVVEVGEPAPSIHFRHLRRAVVVWVDGHVSREELAFSKHSDEHVRQFPLGWFGPRDNSLFSPR